MLEDLMKILNNEFYYAELLELMKKKELEKENSYYCPIEIDNRIENEGSDEKKPERGIIVIEF